MTVVLNTPIEVNYKQLYTCQTRLRGAIAFQDNECRSDGKFFVKLLVDKVSYLLELQKILSYPDGIPA